MSADLETASQISGVISGVVVVGGAIAACWKCNSIIRMMVRIAEGQPRRGDLELVEEGLANHPGLEQTASVARAALNRAHFPGAAANIATIQDNARRRRAGDSSPPRNGTSSRSSPGEMEQHDRRLAVPEVVAIPNREQASPGRRHGEAGGVRSRPGRVAVHSVGEIATAPFQSTIYQVRPTPQLEQGRGPLRRHVLASTKGGHTGQVVRGPDGRQSRDPEA